MTIWTKIGLTATMLVASVTPSLAFLDCPVPEIDGPAGISAVALLASAAVIAYNRARQG